jgi:aspartyl-tRNA(Asn)/glutamyl-tRNA(Gln) amidotransferase subunit A
VPEEVGQGIRLGVKDLFDTAGLTTTYGSAIFRGHVPERTAPAVERLEAAGYAIVGKTNLHEFAYGITSENPHYGDVVNPIDRRRIPGGSSGGSAAALAAGLCDTALGTDSAGSIRIPAACCGIVGFKPTHGLVPMEGCFPLAPSYDTAGPMARDVAGCARMMEALAPGLAPMSVDVGELRVGVAWLEHAEPLVRARVEKAAATLRAEPVEVPLPDYSTYAAFAGEAADVHRDLFARDAVLYGENVRTKIERCLATGEEEIASAIAARKLFVEAYLGATDGLDLLVTPTLACVAPPTGIGDLALREDLIRLTYPFNFVGAPVLALPCGPADEGLPASVSLAGGRGEDALVLAAGAALERFLPNAS